MKHFFRIAAVIGVVLAFYEGAAASLWCMTIALAIDTILDFVNIIMEDD